MARAQWSLAGCPLRSLYSRAFQFDTAGIVCFVSRAISATTTALLFPLLNYLALWTPLSSLSA